MIAAAGISQTAPRDHTARTVLLVALGGLLLVVAIAIFAPGADDDPTPSTWNTGKAGAKAALLLLGSLGYRASAYDQPLDRLPLGDAPRTTLILAEPDLRNLSPEALPANRKAVQRFLERGGAVLATGAAGASLLDRAENLQEAKLFGGLCVTTPEGRGPLARAGSVPLAAPVYWAPDPARHGADSLNDAVAQRCNDQAVVVRWAAGAGQATWWSSATPLTNQGLHDDPSLRLLLASLAPPTTADRSSRIVLFDEAVHGAGSGAAPPPSPLRGLPLPLLLGQAGLVAVLMVFSFSRRHGPVRSPAAAPRSSPLEFAYSMGGLYSRAGATSAPMEAAERRLHAMLHRTAALPENVLQAGPAAIAAALSARFGAQPAWDELSRDLTRAAARDPAPSRAQALAIVRALDRQTAALPESLGRTAGGINDRQSGRTR